MAAFFFVSGFLASLVTERTGSKKFVGRRVQALLVPLLICMILLNPITNYLVYIRYNAPVSMSDYFLGGVWKSAAEGPGSAFLHLWFLFTLLVYVFLTPTMRVLSKSRIGIRLSAILLATGQVKMLAIMAGAVAMGVVLGRVIFEVGFAPLVNDTPFDYVARASLNYIPYFFMGLFVECYRDVFKRFHQINIVLLILGVLIVVGLGFSEPYLPRQINTVLNTAGRALLTTVVIAALLWIFGKYANAENRTVTVLTQSMYSIYLFHYFTIFFFGHLLKDLITNDYLLYGVLVTATIGFGLLVHLRFVSRYAGLAFLFNGQLKLKVARQ